MAEEIIEITPYDTPWEIACLLINARHETTNFLGEKINSKFFSITDLRCIGEHLVNYCNAERRKENDNG
jgi:hypothetical protein